MVRGKAPRHQRDGRLPLTIALIERIAFLLRATLQRASRLRVRRTSVSRRTTPRFLIMANAPVSSKRSSESADVKGRTGPRAAEAAWCCAPRICPPLPHLKRSTKLASRASADATVQEHRFEGGGPFGLPGRRLPTPPSPAVAPGAPPASHAVGVTDRSSTPLGDTSTGNNTTSAPPPPSPSLCPSTGGASDRGRPPGPAPVSGSARSRSGSI